MIIETVICKIRTLTLIIALFMYQELMVLNCAYSQSNLPQSSNQAVFPENIKERLKDIYEENIFSVNTFGGRWLPDGSGYLDLENIPGQDTKALVSYDVHSGEQVVLLSKVTVEGLGYTSLFNIKNYILSSDGDKVLVELKVLPCT